MRVINSLKFAEGFRELYDWVDDDTVETLDQYDENDFDVIDYDALEKGDVDRLGEYLDVHWMTKKQLSKSISNKFIDDCYTLAKKNRALGGKIMGAGGGGFFMFYHNGSNK